jgi:hypothetical protein
MVLCCRSYKSLRMAKRSSAVEGLKSAQVRGGRGLKSTHHAAGWLRNPGEPTDELIELAGWTWSKLYVTAKRPLRIYKLVKNTGEWFRFAFTEAASEE